MTPTNAYIRGAIETATPAQLILALYDGALVAIKRAVERMASADIGAVEVAHRELVRAQNIIIELRVSLDTDRGGDIAINLDSLYGFFLERIIEANVKKDPSGLAPVMSGLRQLREGWAEACCRPAAAAAGLRR